MSAIAGQTAGLNGLIFLRNPFFKIGFQHFSWYKIFFYLVNTFLVVKGTNNVISMDTPIKEFMINDGVIKTFHQPFTKYLKTLKICFLIVFISKNVLFSSKHCKYLLMYGSSREKKTYFWLIFFKILILKTLELKKSTCWYFCRQMNLHQSYQFSSETLMDKYSGYRIQDTVDILDIEYRIQLIYWI